jgi:MFS transporter, DHA2 family, methylenomycin A resistance protein
MREPCPEPRRRVRAVGAWSGIGAVALVAGPTLGGLAAATVGWRVVFWLNLPVAAAAFVLAEVLLPETDPKKRGLDPAGQALAIVTLTTLAGSLIEAGRLGWLSPPVLGGLLLAAAAATLFVAVERRVAEPMVPPDLLRRSGLVAPVVVGMLYNFAFYGVQFVASLYLQNARGASPAEVGLLFLPFTVTCAAFAFAAGPVAARCGPKVPMAAGMAVAALGALSMAALGPAGTALAAGGALVGLGGGLLSGPMTACVLASAPRERAGTASGLLNAARQAGGVLGIAVLGSVLGPTGAGEGSSRAALGIVAAAFATAALLALAFIRHDATAHAGT